MGPCLHVWELSRPHKKNGNWVTHHRCQICGGEKDLIEEITTGRTFVSSKPKKYYTDITYPENKEVEDMPAFSKENYQERMQASKENARRKDEIIRTWQECGGQEKYGSIAIAAKKIGISPATLRGRLIRWGAYKVEKRLKRKDKPTVEKRATEEEFTIPATIAPHPHNGVPVAVVETLLLLDKIEDMKIFWEGYKIGRGLKEVKHDNNHE